MFSSRIPDYLSRDGNTHVFTERPLMRGDASVMEVIVISVGMILIAIAFYRLGTITGL